MPDRANSPVLSAQGLRLPLLVALVIAALFAACSNHRDLRRLSEPSVGMRQLGRASWYGTQFHGRKTASGEVYDMDGISAAHRTLPFGTVVQVVNLDTSRTIELEINDRGPFVDDRILDLSRGAARQVGMIDAGVADIELTVLSLPASMGGRFLIQVGAYRDRDNALYTLQRIEGLVPEAEIYTDGPWHRVQVRGFDSRKEARETRQKVRSLGLEALVRESSAGNKR